MSQRPYAQLRATIFTPLRRSASPLEPLRAYTRATDEFLRAQLSAWNRHYAQSQELALIALGGYGRGELAPYSDIDVLVLHTPEVNRVALEALVRQLWDAGLNLGCVVRTLGDCARILGDDLASDIALLESTFLAGNQGLYTRLVDRVLKPWLRRKGGTLLVQLRAALSEGIYSDHNTLYRIEPDLKNGICCLRDCHRVQWIERVLEGAVGGLNKPLPMVLKGEARSRFEAAYNFLLGLRSELHMQAGRRYDVLDVAHQPAVAQAQGFGAGGEGLLMERFFREVSVVKHAIQLCLERVASGVGAWGTFRRYISSWPVCAGVAVVDGMLVPARHGFPPRQVDAAWMMAVFKGALGAHATLSTPILSLIRERVGALDGEQLSRVELQRDFYAMLQMHREVGRIIQLMHDCGFLTALIPEFAPLTCKVEYDAYHEYTVDEHSIMAVRQIDKLNQEPDEHIRTVYLQVNSRALLRLVVLLHDCGKPLPGDHCISGALLAQQVARRLGFSHQEQQSVALLVKHHLTLSRLSFERHAEDEQLRQLGVELGERANLDLLYLLTVLDIRNVGPRIWTRWKGAQLQEIYTRTLALLPPCSSARVDCDDEAVAGVADVAVAPHFAHPEWLGALRTGEAVLRVEPLEGFQRFTVVSLDEPLSFSRAVGCLASEGMQILSARVWLLQQGQMVSVIDALADERVKLTFDEQMEKLQSKWQRLAQGRADCTALVTERMRRYPPKRHRGRTEEAVVKILNRDSSAYTVIEVLAPDSAGLLYALVRTLAEAQLAIVGAKIATRVDRVTDVFYVTTASGEKVVDEQRCATLEQQLKAAAMLGVG
jgi:[protein-PII] uridylyltransferase